MFTTTKHIVPRSGVKFIPSSNPGEIHPTVRSFGGPASRMLLRGGDVGFDSFSDHPSAGRTNSGGFRRLLDAKAGPARCACASVSQHPSTVSNGTAGRGVVCVCVELGDAALRHILRTVGCS